MFDAAGFAGESLLDAAAGSPDAVFAAEPLLVAAGVVAALSPAAPVPASAGDMAKPRTIAPTTIARIHSSLRLTAGLPSIAFLEIVAISSRPEQTATAARPVRPQTQLESCSGRTWDTHPSSGR